MLYGVSFRFYHQFEVVVIAVVVVDGGGGDDDDDDDDGNSSGGGMVVMLSLPTSCSFFLLRIFFSISKLTCCIAHCVANRC